MLSSPRKPSRTMRIFSSAEKCRRVARRMSFTTCSAGALADPDFCLIFAPSKGYDEPEVLPSSTHPVCLTIADAGQLKSVSAEGDQAEQMILTALYFGFTGLLLRKVHPRAMLFVGAPLILLFGWTMASAMWSVNADLTVRRTAALLGTIIIGLYLGLRFDHRRLLHLLALVAIIVLGLSLLVALFAPLSGLDFEG